ncbi:MAG: response regulator [Proteobacteria bacterium]|nr:response regulator [Pseudomonadota bacterium]
MKILIIDDEESMNVWIGLGLRKKGYDVVTFTDPVEALEEVKKGEIGVFVSDIKMPKMDGIEFLKNCRKIDSSIKGILMTAYGSVDGVIEGFREGAVDFLIKPFSLEELYNRIKKLESTDIIKTAMREEDKIIYKSEAIKDILATVDNIAQIESTVIIYGETGTGKELIAKRIHKKSKRRTGKFVSINCAALPENLLESELFGYKKGAFTGAYKDKIGLLEVANGGTFFLDEIGEMPLSLQAKLLRVIQEREIVPIGGHNPMKIDVRLIAATNKDLKKLIEKGEFREDLYYRLNVIPIHVPPLRERPEDIPELMKYFVKKYASKFNILEPVMDEDIMEKFTQYSWPGNVRELENIVERMVVMGVEGTLSMFGKSVGKKAIKGIKEQEIELIKETLKKTKGNKKATAKILGIDYSTLYRKIKRYGIESKK